LLNIALLETLPDPREDYKVQHRILAKELDTTMGLCGVCVILMWLMHIFFLGEKVIFFSQNKKPLIEWLFKWSETTNDEVLSAKFQLTYE
jgi:hypothetical protein